MTLIQSLNITRGMARVAIEGAIKESLSRGKRCCIAVVDAAGDPVSFDRMDGAPLQSVRVAQDKAYSNAANRFATDEFWVLVKNDDGELIAAIGVSGDGNMEDEKAIGAAGAEAVHALLAKTGLAEAIPLGAPRA